MLKMLSIWVRFGIDFVSLLAPILVTQMGPKINQITNLEPRRPQEGPRGFQEAPKRPQEASKRPPRGLQEAPKRPPRGPKMPRRRPKRALRGPKRHPKREQVAE